MQLNHESQAPLLLNWLSEAPANTMLIGEHSVVYGHPALACALNQWIHIHWQQRPDKALNIHSALGEHHTQIEQITIHPKLRFVIAALQAFQPQLEKQQQGLDIHIESEFSSTIGLGSSAAVLAAMLDGLNEITDSGYSRLELFQLGHRIIRDIQGRGSGTDLAASLYGGVIYYQPIGNKFPQPKIEKLNFSLPLTLIYAGYKTPTSEVLAKVAQDWENKPKELEMLYRSMAQVTKTAYQALQADDLETFYQQCDLYQSLMETLGVSDEVLDDIITHVKSCEAVKAAKISGSGLGDCILSIGHLERCTPDVQMFLESHPQIDVIISKQGASTRKEDSQ